MTAKECLDIILPILAKDKLTDGDYWKIRNTLRECLDKIKMPLAASILENSKFREGFIKHHTFLMEKNREHTHKDHCALCKERHDADISTGR